MTTPAATAEPTPTVDPAPGSDSDAAYLLQHLRIILEAGTKLVQDLVADPLLPAISKAEPFDRLARAVRRTAALIRHIAENPVKRAPTAAEHRAQSRRKILRDVENLIETHAKQPERAESLREELDERLDDPEFDRDLATRPVEEIIRDIKRDLGLDPDGYWRYRRRTPADIRDLNARAAAPPPPQQPASQPPASTPEHQPAPPPTTPAFDYKPGQTRPNPLLARYRQAADG